LFHKGQVLFNAHRAHAAAHKAGTVIAVEGYMDAIALAQAGIAHVVAPLGTALTEGQIGLLWRMAPEPVLCFDGDKAGQRAAYRAVEAALPHVQPGRSLRFAFLPDGQDPDDLVRVAGRMAFDEVVQQARPLVDVLWERELDAASADTPEQRAALERRLMELVRSIKDETVRRHYQTAMAEKMQIFAPQPAAYAPVPFERRGGGGRSRGERRPRTGLRAEALHASAALRQL